jgi:RPA family protein
MSSCHECGNPTVKKHGDVEVQTPEVGKFTAKSIIYMGCDNCGAKIIFPEYAEKVNKQILKLHITKTMKSNKNMSMFDLVKEVNDNDLIYQALDELIEESVIKETTNNKKIRTFTYIKKEEVKKENWFKSLLKKYFN